MTPRAFRLTSQEIFLLRKSHYFVANHTFKILFQPQKHSRLKWHTIVSGRASKKTSHRHRSRRIVDEAIKTMALTYMGKGINLLILVKKDLYHLKTSEIKQKLQPLLTSIQSS